MKGGSESNKSKMEWIWKGITKNVKEGKTQIRLGIRKLPRASIRRKKWLEHEIRKIKELGKVLKMRIT